MCHMCNASRDISPLVLVLLVPAGQPPGVQGVVGRHGGRGAKLQIGSVNIPSLDIILFSLDIFIFINIFIFYSIFFLPAQHAALVQVGEVEGGHV